MPDQERINRKLRNYLGFSEEDLMANRAGQLSKRQRRRFVFSANIELAVLWSVEIVLVYILVLFPMPPQFMLVFVAGIFIMPKGMYEVIKKGRRHANPSAVVILEGPVALAVEVVHHEKALTPSNAYYLKIDGQTINVSQSVANCIVDGHIYRVHVMRYRREILSAEFVQ